MSLRRHAGARHALTVLALAALTLSACATAPTAPKGAAGKADPNYGRMAPIPNPIGDERPAASRPVPRQAAPAAAAPPRVASPSKPPPAAAKPPPANGRDPAKARALRAQGLEELNKGAIDKAQDLLRQALRLDPGNTLIQRDLDRATRIGQALRSKP